MDNMKKKNNEQEYMKKVAIDGIMEQLKLRGENATRADRFARHDLDIVDKDLKIRVKFCKPIKRSGSSKGCWEFTKVIHSLRLWPRNVFDYYLLVGFDDNMTIQKIWKISVDDKLIYRKNLIFIPIDDPEDYNGYELKLLNEQSKDIFEWIR